MAAGLGRKGSFVVANDTAPEGANRFKWLRVWLKRELIARFFKYVVLLFGLSLTLRVVFDCYSFYVARRDIDTELQSKKVSSLEYLSVLSKRDRALVLASLETRCLERTELTLFRIFDAELEGSIKVAFQKFIDQKGAIIDVIRKADPGMIDITAAADYVNGATFTIAGLEHYLKPLGGHSTTEDAYKKFREELDVDIKKYIDLGGGHSSLRKRAEGSIRAKLGPESANYLSLDAIKTLEARLARLKKARAESKELLGDLDDVMARYGIWTGALTGGVAETPVLDEMAYQLGTEGDQALATADCSQFKEYYQAVDRKLYLASPTHGKTWAELNLAQQVRSLPLLYDLALLTYFQQPPAAQTLLVTLFLGALGALTLNVLRMSKVGWWARENDPLWGEIIVSPLLGSLAAFAIFLVGSAGLLLTTGAQGGVSPLSAFFIGLLGFLSGLLYDEAFGRVRRVGIQMFRDGPADAAAGRPEDRALAETLKGANASLAAGLALKYGIGTRLATEPAFTLIIPADDATGSLSLATWTRLNDPDSGAFEKWYRRHHARVLVTRSDVGGAGPTPAPNELAVDEGPPLKLAIVGADLKIGDVRVLIADVPWKKGVIQIVSEDIS
jgi:hypothetical protein